MRTAHREVGLSSSRPSRGASRSMDCMKTARRTEGVFPTTAAKQSSKAMVHTAVRRRRAPSRAAASPARKETWRPETAMTWASPDRRRAA